MDDIITQFSKKRQRIAVMFSSYDYMNWLEKFVGIHGEFYDDSWLYEPEKISKEDYEKVLDLPLFFEGIEAYAQKNFIYPFFDKCSFYNCYYLIRYNRTVYKIAMTCGQGTQFSFQKAENTMSGKIIDFCNVIDNKSLESTKSISEKLDILSNDIKEMINSGVPSESIHVLVEELTSNKN